MSSRELYPMVESRTFRYLWCSAAEQQGFSLLEVLISAVLLTILLGGLYTVLFQSQATYDAQQDAMALRQQARLAVDQMATEIRMAGGNLDNLTEAITDAAPRRIVFVADIDSGSPSAPCGAAFETAVDGGAERMTYQVLVGMLTRTVDCWDGAAWTNEYTDQVVARDLVGAAPVFRYFDENGAELVPAAGGLTPAQRDEVRVVSISVEMQDAEQQVLPDSLVGFELATQVKLRNAGS